MVQRGLFRWQEVDPFITFFPQTDSLEYRLCHYVLISIMNAPSPQIATPDVSRIIEMAWEDRTPFEAIETLYG